MGQQAIMEAEREARIRLIMEQLRRDPQYIQIQDEVRQALQRSGRLLESLSPGSIDSVQEEQQLLQAEEKNLRKQAEDLLMRQEIRERILTEGGSVSGFDAQLYVLDQQRALEANKWRQQKLTSAEAAREEAYEQWQRQLLRSYNSRLGLLHPKPCSC